MPELTFELAVLEDDGALRLLLRENPVAGRINLSFEREPSYFAAASIDGPMHQTIVAREKSSGNIVGFSTRSGRRHYVNGRQQMIGYLGNLRLDHRHRTGFPAIGGYRYCGKLHRDGQVPYYITSILEGNQAAERLLTSGLRGLPRYDHYCRYTTYTLFVKRTTMNVPAPPDLEIVPGEPRYESSLFECLQRNGSRHQFSPFWTQDNLFRSSSTPGLAITDFYLAVKGGHVMACLALWNQLPVKQTVIRGFSRGFAKFVPLYNLVAKIRGYPGIPGKGQTLQSAYLSHLAVDDDDPQVFAALLSACYRRAAMSSIDYLLIGFADGHPLLPVVRGRYKTFTTGSNIYLVSWPDDGIDPLSLIDNRTPGLDAALL